MADDLTTELKAFVERHPDGWGHEDWTRLLADLDARGFDTSDTESIGFELERCRIVRELEQRDIRGLGPKRTESLAHHFSSWWDLCQATEDEIARAPKVPEAVAEKVRAAL